MNGTTAEQTPRFTVHFHDDHIAPAPAGLYTAALEHTVEGPGVDDVLLPVQKDFEIRAPQFTLDASFVHALHPAPGASGAFEYVLPHITLNRLILPWERSPDPDDLTLPWLALLLFAEEELPDDPKAQATTRTRTVREVVRNTDPTVLTPEINRVPEELLDSECATVDIPADVYAALIPRKQELRHLCHLRRVRDRQAARVLGPAGEILETGDYGVVVANRFPRTAGRYAAHLVALEGFADHLDGARPTQDTVRMVSLVAWSFEAVPDAGGHFAALIRALAEDPAGLGLRLTGERPAQGPAADRLAQGYAPVGHVLPSGERTFAWYRGPLTPVVPRQPPGIGDTPLRHADEALIYLTDSGVLDVGYASAFTLGRSLTLADDTLASALASFRSRTRRIAARALAHSRTAVSLAADSAHPARDRFHRLIEDGLGERLHRAARTTGTATAGRPRRQGGGVPRPPSPTELRNGALRAGPLNDALLRALDRPLAELRDTVDQVTLIARTPLHHLVPDARMLPAESLRFFHVDPWWCAALRDGVLSTGIGTTLDEVVNRLAYDTLDAPRPLSGLLMRSALVRGWPEVVVEPLGTGAGLLDIVHRRTIGPDLLFCLIDGVPDEVVFREPHAGIHFGVDESDRIGLRRLTPPVGDSLGEEASFPADGDITRFLRTSHGGSVPEILSVTAGPDPLVPALAAALRDLGELPDGQDLSPGALAVELVNAPQRISFTPGRR
ncbi:hypothetical protein ACIBCM_04520 [Streptomyces sp. NPDC051018]|uniref:hypothetical protein n=1 Tax=Streptomyces sp. NPDC051018 TaxID=3365639 RepID=UPI0037A4AAEB